VASNFFEVQDLNAGTQHFRNLVQLMRIICSETERHDINFLLNADQFDMKYKD
jgi:predicted NAD/FAD-binding protein